MINRNFCISNDLPSLGPKEKITVPIRSHCPIVKLQLEMDKSFKVVNLLWISLKGICREKGTQTV